MYPLNHTKSLNFNYTWGQSDGLFQKKVPISLILRKNQRCQNEWNARKNFILYGDLFKAS